MSVRLPDPGDVAALLGDPGWTADWLFEVEPYSTEAAATEWLRYSTHDLTTAPTDSPANTRLPGRLHDFQFRAGLWGGDGVFGGSRVNTGTAALDTADGGLNGLLGLNDGGERAYHFRRRRWRALIGHRSWTYGDFRPVASGLVEDVEADDEEVRFQLRDRLIALDKPVQERVFGGDRVVLASGSTLTNGTGSKSFTIPNLVTNGDFPSNLGSWTAGTGWTQSAGKASKSAGTGSALTQAIVTSAGNAFYLRVVVVVTTGTLTFTVGGSAVGAAISASGTYEFDFTADGSSTTIGFSADAAFAGTVDDVTARQNGAPLVGDDLAVGETGDLVANWMLGTVVSWTRSTGVLATTMASAGGSDSVSAWSIYLRPYAGTAENAGKPIPLALGTCRFAEPEALGVVLGLWLYMVNDGPASLSAAYDGAKALTPAGSFPPDPGEYFFDVDRGALWVCTRPALLLTVDAGQGGGDFSVRRVYDTEGSVALTVPADVTTIHVKAWGAGGAGGNASGGSAKGGAGGFVEADITVTPGEALTVVVGGPGQANNSTISSPTQGPGGTSAIAPGGKGGVRGAGISAGGGGASGVKRGATAILIAPGGGGAAANRDGGPGGGADGIDGDDLSSKNGDGGHPGSGGLGGDGDNDGDAGAALQGGEGGDAPTGGEPGGGGGGGRYGGGGGAGDDGGNHGAGGGGSALVPSGGTTEAGSGQDAGGDDDDDYALPAGRGGNDSGAGPAERIGSPGRVVVSWSVAIPSGDEPTAAEMLEGLCRDTFGEQAVRVTQTTLTSVAASGSTLTFGGGDITTLVQPGDVFSFSGLSAGANNGVNLHAVSVTTTTIVCRETLATMSADTSFEMRIGTLDFVALDALAAASSAPLGRYCRDDIPTGRQLVDEILNTIGGWWATDADSLLTFGILDLPGADTVAAYDGRHLDNAPRLRPAGQSNWRRRVGAERCWRVHDTSEIATDAGEDDDQFVRQEWREGVATREGYRTKDISATDVFVESLFAAKADADVEAERQAPMFSPDRQAWELPLDHVALTTPLGAGITFEAPIVGVNSPRAAIVLDREIQAAENSVRLTVWS